MMARAIPTRKINNRKHFVSRMRRLNLRGYPVSVLGDGGTGSGRVRGRRPLHQPATWLCRDPSATHSQVPPPLLGYFDCSERLQELGKGKACSMLN